MLGYEGVDKNILNDNVQKKNGCNTFLMENRKILKYAKTTANRYLQEHLVQVDSELNSACNGLQGVPFEKKYSLKIV